MSPGHVSRIIYEWTDLKLSLGFTWQAVSFDGCSKYPINSSKESAEQV